MAPDGPKEADRQGAGPTEVERRAALREAAAREIGNSPPLPRRQSWIGGVLSDLGMTLLRPIVATLWLGALGVGAIAIGLGVPLQAALAIAGVVVIAVIVLVYLANTF